MRIVVVGAGAWGLPAALQLQSRGHTVHVLDRYGPGNPYSSSAGTTRLWRLVDVVQWRGEALAEAVSATRRLEDRLDATLMLRQGLLWRDGDQLAAAARVLDAIGAPYDAIDAADVGRPPLGLRPDGRDAIFVHDAGTILPHLLLERTLNRFRELGGRLEIAAVTSVHDGSGVRAVTADGRTITADHLVLAAGPGSAPLLRQVGVDLPLRPYLEQVVHFSDALQPNRYDAHPCLFDAPTGEDAGIYCMPAPGRGYKVGLDRPLRPLEEPDLDRDPAPSRTASITSRVARDLRGVEPRPGDAQVCSWTDSPDGDFVIDRIGDAVTVACGDSGEGFKFAALVGELVADLVEGRPPAASFAARWSTARFADGVPAGAAPSALGRH